jgi:hypothetical protein
MMASTSIPDLPDLPDPGSIYDEGSANEALFGALATVAAANHKLSKAAKTGVLHRHWDSFMEEITSLFRGLHDLLPAIAEYRPDITSWSVTVGMSNTLTVNIASKHAQGSPDFCGAELDGPCYYV